MLFKILGKSHEKNKLCRYWATNSLFNLPILKNYNNGKTKYFIATVNEFNEHVKDLNLDKISKDVYCITNENQLNITDTSNKKL